MIFYAHTAEDSEGRTLYTLKDGHQTTVKPRLADLAEEQVGWQPLRTHLLNVAQKARQLAEAFGLGEEGYVAGLLHDLGKYRTEFQTYLRGQCESSAATQHAIFGAAWAFDKELAASAFAVAGHHAGLHDVGDLQSNVERVSIRPALESLITALNSTSEVGAPPQMPSLPSWASAISDPAQAALATDVYTRLLFSTLVDADRLDTACWPTAPTPDQPLRAEDLLLCVLQERDRKRALNPSSPLAAFRNRIFDACQLAAAQPPGFFSLTVPTGGGKTISAMNFALAHAKAHGLRRVIVVIPYLSIIEQNAAEYRRIFGENAVVEVHSAIEPRADASEEEKDRLELVSENWDAPVIVTTSVQFIESLLANSASRCRKLHRIARSVVIFDEVQTLPAHLLAPTFSILREFQRNYGTTFVFSSATQPAFRRSPSLPDGFGPDELQPILPESDQREMYRALRRVRYHLPKPDETLDWPLLAERLSSTAQVLCVVNLTRHAALLWEQLCRRLPQGERPIHLSSAMCAAHRLALLYCIKRRLKLGQACRVVATQLIEAGVDVDFPVVWRAFGPLDSIVQVAGRCNREGRLPAGEMHVFRPVESKLPGKLYEAATGQAGIQLAHLAARGDVEELLATDPDVFGDYFHALWQIVQTDVGIQDDRQMLRFRAVAEKARVIKDDTRPVIVPVGKARRFIHEIRERQNHPGRARFDKADVRRLQRFMVNVRSHKFQILEGHKLIRPLLPNLDLFVLNEGLYHRDLGLVIDQRPLEDFLL